MALCILIVLPIITAEGQVWVGSYVGYEVPVSAISDQRRGAGFVGVLGRGFGNGVDIGFQAIRRWQIDFFISGYASGLVDNSDADPYSYLSLGARRRWFLAEKAGAILPFASAGLGVGFTAYHGPAVYAQGELGIDFAPTRSVGFELGIRDRAGFPIVQSAQVFLLLRIGRMTLPK
jgi:hypothetical protein